VSASTRELAEALSTEATASLGGGVTSRNSSPICTEVTNRPDLTAPSTGGTGLAGEPGGGRVVVVDLAVCVDLVQPASIPSDVRASRAHMAAT
jgi:hypothetical protein